MKRFRREITNTKTKNERTTANNAANANNCRLSCAIFNQIIRTNELGVSSGMSLKTKVQAEIVIMRERNCSK